MSGNSVTRRATTSYNLTDSNQNIVGRCSSDIPGHRTENMRVSLPYVQYLKGRGSFERSRGHSLLVSRREAALYTSTEKASFLEDKIVV
jgi:hypothetical protein